jgi:hypothetical protein
MRILPPGANKAAAGSAGFVLLRDLMVMFIVIVCFAAAAAAMTVYTRQGMRLLETVQKAVAERNETVTRLLK